MHKNFEFCRVAEFRPSYKNWLSKSVYPNAKNFSDNGVPGGGHSDYRNNG